MTFKPFYAIRHKPTGFFMPEPKGRQGRGSSWWDPKEQTDEPRLFRFERSAKGALTQWLRGKHQSVIDHDYDEFSGNYHAYQAGVEAIEVEGRRREDMEIVIFEIVEIV